MEKGKEFDGNIPTILARGNTIPEAWENSLNALDQQGIWYARQGPKDKGQYQVDSTMIIEIKEPSGPFLMHKYAMIPPDSLLEYGMEFLGAKNCLAVDTRYESPDDPRWPYTYPGRFSEYGKGLGEVVDQIAKVVKRLAEKPHKRNNQMITWQPQTDIDSKDPACLQRAWFFPVPMPDGSSKLNANYHFRSRNPMIAAPMNLFGEHVFHSWIGNQVQEQSGIEILGGRMVDITDSFHISSRDKPLFRNFLENYKASTNKGETINQRAYTREWVLTQMQDMLFTGEIKNKIIGQINDRYKERTNANPSLAQQLKNEETHALQKLDGIDKWITNFLK